MIILNSGEETVTMMNSNTLDHYNLHNCLPYSSINVFFRRISLLFDALRTAQQRNITKHSYFSSNIVDCLHHEGISFWKTAISNSSRIRDLINESVYLRS